MTARRGRGEGGLYWHEGRQRWIAEVTLGYDGRGKRIQKRGSGRTKTEAKLRLKQVLRDHEDGLAIAPEGYTVGDAVSEWLQFGVHRGGASTLANYERICRLHILPKLGARKLRDLSAEEVDRWLAQLARFVSTRTLRLAHGCLNRAVSRAMARDKVKRNVVPLASVPKGQPGRPSKSLNLAQAKALLDAAECSRLNAYIVVSLLTGARTEELRALRWEHVHMDRTTGPAYIEVWRSVRAGGDTKTRVSRRTLALPSRCIVALVQHRERQAVEREAAGWTEHGYVFPSRTGTAADAHNMRREFRAVLAKIDGMDPGDWTPRELRHSFVSLLSDSGIPIEEISRLVGHSSTAVTEQVYRHQIRPVVQDGAIAMDRLFGSSDEQLDDQS
jgi:integrase